MSASETELALVTLAAMASPTTLSFCVLALVLGDRPLRTGTWFYAGALGTTLAVGVVAAFVIGDVAASHNGSPKTWVAILDVVFGVLLIGYVVVLLRRPPNPAKRAQMTERMRTVASSPAIAIVGAGAALANPGGFIPIALKDISQADPSAAGYAAYWVVFAVGSLLPLAVALVALRVARRPTTRLLNTVRDWLERHARVIAAVLLVALAAALLRNGIVGLTS
jgi:heme exporter protein D